MAMFLIIILALFILSKFIWNIEINITGDDLTEDEILSSLNENGLYIGESKRDIDIKEIVNNIRLARSDIAWIGIELKGTNAIVEVVEAEEKPEIIAQDEYCNIVSDKEGKIVKINANTGTAMVKPGDVVKEGTLLIGGWMEGKYTGTRFVRATGEIEAVVWYTEKETVNFKETKVEKTGNMTRILPRKNELIRPAVANIDQALVVFAVTEPKPHYNLLDRFLVMMERKEIPVILCFNKTDLAEHPEIAELEEVYASCGYPVLFTSAKKEENIEKLKQMLKGKTTSIAGPSGVGKSSLINLLQSGVQMETGSISRKIARGKHTTRHSELIMISPDSYIMDTPGFSSLYVNDFEKEELKYYFPEFSPYEGKCRFNGCDHIHEPGCAVKEAVESGAIHKIRYEDYTEMYRELKEKKRY